MQGDAITTGVSDSLVQVFERRAAGDPARVALICDRRETTYDELNGRANQFARLLRSRGATPGDLVAVSLDRSATTFTVLMGILKAGCAYVPLDPTLPPRRRTEIARDSRAQILVVTHDEFRLQDFDGRHVIVMPQIEREPADDHGHTVATVSAATDVCCVLYTSGTTGTPKGVAVPGQAILNHASWMWRAHPFGDRDIALIHRSPTYMAATWDYFGPLLGGVPAVILPGHQTSDPAVLMRLCIEHGVTHVSGSPGFWQALLDRPATQREAWRTLRLGTSSGEPLPVSVAVAWRRAFPRGRLLNVYGITEAVRPAVYDTSGMAGDETRVPIGTPLPNVSLSIVDDDLAPVGDGEIGELCIAGPCLARGYLNDAPLTRERFITDPSSAGDVIFRTGDFGRRRPDGDVELVARRDHRVKIRGFRVELEEIEADLDRCPLVRRVAVVAHDDESGDRRLIAYVVPAAGAMPDWRELRTFLEARLPDHMIPSSFVLVDEIPLTPSGKVDRQLLAAREAPAAPQGKPAAEPPRTPTEEALGRIWSEVIGVGAIGLDDRFLELGGHSLVAMQITSRVYDALQIELPLETFFPNPTLRATAAAIDELRQSDAGACVAADDRRPERP